MSPKSPAWVSVVYSLEKARLVRRLAQERGMALADVCLLTKHTYLARHIQGEISDIRTVSFEEVPGVNEAIALARQHLEEAEASITAAFEATPLGWITLWQWYAGYVYERDMSYAVSRALLTHFSHHRWFFLPQLLCYSNNFNSTLHTSPVWDMVLFRVIRESGSSYECLGWSERRMAWRRTIAQAATIIANLGLALVGAFLSTLIGLGTWWRRVPHGKRVLNMSPDTYVFSHRERLHESLQKEDIILVDFRLHQIALHSERRFGGWLSFLWHLVPVWRGGGREAPVLTLDSRRAISQYWTFEVWPDAGALVRLCRACISMLLSWEKVWRALGTNSWWERILVLTWLPQSLVAQAQGEWLLSRWQPQAVLFPSGHNALLRYLQWQVKQGRLLGINSPHGYPNRRWPNHYEVGDWFIAPTLLSQRQGHPQQRTIAVGSDKLTLNPRAAGTHMTEGAIGILYPGTTGGWAHPNDLDELWQASLDTVRALHKALPERHIILKSHPNGTETAFFTALIRETGIPSPYLQHVPQGWNEKQFQELACAITLVVLPSSPTMDALRFGIPLVAVAGPSFKGEQFFQSSPARIYDFPFLVHSPAHGVEKIVSWLTSEARYHEAEQAMLKYGRNILGLNASYPPMAEVLPRLLDTKK